MSRPWKPDPREHWTAIQGYARETKRGWPPGATAGVLLVGAACLAVAWSYSRMASRRELVDSSATQWKTAPKRAAGPSGVAGEKRAQDDSVAVEVGKG